MTTSCWGDVGVSQKKQFREDSCDFVDKKERDESTHVTLTRLYLLSCSLLRSNCQDVFNFQLTEFIDFLNVFICKFLYFFCNHFNFVF